MIGVRYWRRQDLVCRQAVELVTDYLEGALPRAQRRRFEAHLASCRDCPEYLAQIRATIALAGSVTPADLSPRVRYDLVVLYRRWQGDGDPGRVDLLQAEGLAGNRASANGPWVQGRRVRDAAGSGSQPYPEVL